MMSIRIEKATPADAPALVELQIRAFHHDAVLYPGVEPDGPPGYDSVDHTLRDIAEVPCYKILADDRIIGGIVVFERTTGHFHLDKIFIDPEYQGRGIGSQAMRFIEHAHPAALWTLHTPTYAVRNQHFYEKHGYIKTGEENLHDFILFAYEKRTS
jgi:ribosomal protein S18 acetylase RimI-like enzyme